jgi:hypothetical protein
MWQLIFSDIVLQKLKQENQMICCSVCLLAYLIYILIAKGKVIDDYYELI